MLQPKQIWRCDICRIRTFPSFQEACDHEAQCSPPSDVNSATAGEKLTPKAAERPRDAVAESSSVIHPLMKSKKRSFDANGTTASTPIEIPSSIPKRKAQPSSARVNKRKISGKEDEEVIVLDTPMTNSFTKMIGRNRTSFSSKDGSSSSKSKVTSGRIGASANKKCSKNNINKPALLEWLSCVPEENPLNDESSSSFLTEQVVAYQFMEQRRLKQLNEREKIQRQQQRRQEEQLLKCSSTSSVSASHDGMMSVVTQDALPKAALRNTKSSSRGQQLAVRFPNPSHVIAAPAVDEIQEDVVRAIPRNWWKPVPCLEIEPMPKSVVPSLLTSSPVMDSTDELQRTIRRYLTLSVANNDQNSVGCLWTDRYYNCSSNQLENDSLKHLTVCFGVSQKMAQEQLERFIERFMMERQKVEELTKEKQKQRLLSFQSQGLRPKSSKKKASSQRSRYDDDLWDDGDSNDGVPKVESSLCLLSGPVGCGKSHLVHAVAKQLGCRKVVELHTGMRRNAASIKRLIEEATKSHSTFDMIHNRNSAADTSSKLETVEAVHKKRHRKVICSDSEESEDDDQNVLSEDRGSAVTVILIDEVDNLDPSTDNGFWTALSDLCKQSKCPIVCTANRIPSELICSSFGWIHVPVERPTSMECAQRLRAICLQESLSLRSDGPSALSTDPWQVIAEAGNCDMRRLLHELQNYKLVASESAEALDMVPMCDLICHAPQSPIVPKIDFIRPRSVPMNEYCLLTISGSNFSQLVDPNRITNIGYPCEVYIEEFLCPDARIMDDSTVLAIAPPLQFPRRIESDTSKFRSLYTTSSYSTTLAPVRICSARKLGITSTTDGAVETIILPDLTKIHIATSPYLLEYQHNCIKEDEESESENEFGSDNISQNATAYKDLQKSALQPPLASINTSLTSELLEDGIESWRSTNSFVEANGPSVDPISIDDNQVFDDMCTKAALASDAALLENVRMTPFLSGSCRGFGFDFTEEFPKRNNGNSKPYVFAFIV
jgi:DNA polymerase III delta prime subunit